MGDLLGGPKPLPSIRRPGQVAPLQPPVVGGLERGQAIPTAPSDMAAVVPPVDPNADLQKLWTDAQTVYNHPKGGHRLADAYVREQSGGAFGYDDLAKNASINPSTAAASVFQGATLGFGDRLRALARTLSTLQAPRPGAKMGGLPVNPDATTAFPPAGTYSRNLAHIRNALAIFRGLNPTAEPLLETGGALATTALGGEAAGLQEGTGLLSSTARGVATGAGLSGVNALGAQADLQHPDWQSILTQMGVGGLAGGATGGLAFEAGRFSPSWLARARLRHALSPEESPELPAIEALYQRTGRGNIRTLADLSPALQAEGDFAATASPEVKMHLRHQFLERSAGQSDRLQDDLTRYYGSTPSRVERAASLRAVANRIENDPETGYEAVASRAGPISDPRLNPLLNRPGVRGPVNTALSELSTGGAPNPQPTDARSLFYVYRRLRGAASSAFSSGDRDLGAALAGAHSDLRDILSTHVPEFGALNARLGPVLGAEHALNDAPNFFTNVDQQTLKAKLNAMTPIERSAYREGTANSLRESLDAARTDRNLARQFDAAGPSMKSKLQLIFGDQTPNFLDATRAESELAQRNSMFGGSPTASREQELHTTPKLRISEGGEGGLLGGLKARLFENLPLFNTRGMARRAGELEAPTLFRPGLPLAEARAALGRRALMDRLQFLAPAGTGFFAAKESQQP